jgi:hypothetical protein
VVTIEDAVRIARGVVRERGWALGEIFWARLTDENHWCISFAVLCEPNARILPDRLTVVVDAESGQASIPTES